MPSVSLLLASTVFAALALVGYAYFAYPLLIYALSRVFGRRPDRPAVSDAELPTVTLVIAAYNEIAEIRKRIDNALLLDYPAGKLDILIASDGSSDGTAAAVLEYAARSVLLRAFDVRRGKAAVLNDVIPHVRGEIVMLSDANTHTSASSARQLAAWFRDPSIGAVCGKLHLVDPVNGRNADGIYWKYETFLKKCESRLGALLGSNGGIYAIRKASYVPIPDDTYVDDFVIPLLARQEHGIRIIYDTDATACEETPASLASEFHRRARIGAGGFQAIGILRGLFHPRHGWVAFTFFNHKLLRWISPFLLIYALLANAFIVFALSLPGLGAKGLLPWMAGLLAAQVSFYMCSILSGMLPSRPRILKVLRLPAMFTLMNAALAVGFYRWIRGRQKAAWIRTARADERPVSGLRDTTENVLIPVAAREAVRATATTSVAPR